MGPNIAFLGTGLMGAPMARNLILAKYSLKLWNRSQEKLIPLVNIGGEATEFSESVVRNADIICMMRENGPVVEEVLFNQRLLDNIKKHAVVIDMSSIPPELAQEHSKKLGQLGIYHIDAPVSGGTTGADEGSLAIMAGGDFDVFNKIVDFFTPLGTATYVGPSGSGQIAKLANQIICGGYLTAVAEGLTLAAAGGANIAKVREALMGGFADSKVLQIHGNRMVDRKFEPGGKCHIFLKDLNTVLSTANKLDLELPTAKLVNEIYTEVCNLGWGDLDQAASLLAIENKNSSIKK